MDLLIWKHNKLLFLIELKFANISHGSPDDTISRKPTENCSAVYVGDKQILYKFSSCDEDNRADKELK